MPMPPASPVGSLPRVQALLTDHFGKVATFISPATAQKFEDVRTFLDAATKGKTDPELVQVREDIKWMIQFVTKRSEAADADRFRYLQTALQLVAFILVILGIGLNLGSGLVEISPFLRAVVISLALPLVVALFGALMIVVLYFMQERFEYPFIHYRHLGNSWRWIHYACIKPDTPERAFGSMNVKYQNTFADYYADDLKEYAKKYLDDPLQQQVMDDLRHLFLLIEYDRYRQRFDRQLTDTAAYTGLVAAGTLAGTLFGSLI